jgi:hypothetical protein
MATTLKSVAVKERLLAAREKMHKEFLKAFDEAQVKFDPESLTTEITSMLLAERREIVLKLIGFSDHWGPLEVDHCNGRDKDSIIGKYIRTAATDAVQKWMDDHLKGAFEAHVRGKFSDAKVKAAAIKEFDSIFQHALHNAIRDLAENMAEQVAEEFSKTVKSTLALSSDD